MEVDGPSPAQWAQVQPPPAAGVSSTALHVMNNVSMDNEPEPGESIFELAFRDVRKHFSPGCYSGSEGEAALEQFTINLREYWKLSPQVPEHLRVRASGYFLKDKAQRWWLTERGPSDIPPHIQTVEQFIDALTAKFTSGDSRERATEALRKLKQGRNSLAEYIDKFSSLYKKAYHTDVDQAYRWFIAGIAPSDRHAAVAWAANRAWKQKSVGLEQMFDYLRVQDKLNATELSMRSKEEDDLEPMDIGAVQTRDRAPDRYKGMDRAPKGHGRPPDRRKETRACYCCGKVGHLVKDCRAMLAMRERIARREEYQRKQAPKQNKGYQGNKSAPTQEVARWRGPRQSEPQQKTRQGSNQH